MLQEQQRHLVFGRDIRVEDAAAGDRLAGLQEVFHQPRPRHPPLRRPLVCSLYVNADVHPLSPSFLPLRVPVSFLMV